MPDIVLSILTSAVIALVIYALLTSVGMVIAQGRFLDLLQNQRIIDAANDQTLADRIKKFDLQRALDYAGAK